MAVNNEARRRKEKLRKRARGAIKKAHALHILCEADVALMVILGSKRYEYRSDDTTTWPPAPQIKSGSLLPESPPSCDIEDIDNISERINPNADVSSPSEQLRHEMATSQSTCSCQRSKDSLITT